MGPGGWKSRGNAGGGGGGGGGGLSRSTSTPVLQNDPRLALQHTTAAKGSGLKRQMSGKLGASRVGSGGWARASAKMDKNGMQRPKSGSFTNARRNSVSKGEMVKLKNISDIFEKAKQHLNDGMFDKAILCYSEVAVEALCQRALCLIQNGDYSEAVVNCDFALHFNPSCGKAMVR